MQGAQILRNEAYIRYVAMTKDEAQSAGGGQMDFLRSRRALILGTQSVIEKAVAVVGLAIRNVRMKRVEHL